MGLSKTIALGAAFTLVALHMPGLAAEVVACEVKRAPRPAVAEATARKPARPERVRTERRESVFYSLIPSRRIILQ